MKKVLSIFFIIAALGTTGAQVQNKTSELKIRITNVKPDGTAIMIGVGNREEAPELMQGAVVRADSTTVICHLKNLPAGKQKVYVFHDQNGNKKLDFSSNGRPAEGTGIDKNNSWDPSIVLGDTLQHIELRMVYFK